jgi:hypothetical protein
MDQVSLPMTSSLEHNKRTQPCAQTLCLKQSLFYLAKKDNHNLWLYYSIGTYKHSFRTIYQQVERRYNYKQTRLISNSAHAGKSGVR